MRLCPIVAAVFALSLGCEGTVDGTGPGDPPITEIPGGTPPDQACMPPNAGAPVPLRRITAPQIEASILDVLGLQAEVAISDETIIGYRSNTTTSVDRATAQELLLTVSELAETAIAGRAGACGDACDAWLLDNIAPQLFRRPLTAEDRALYQGVYDDGFAEAGAAAGAQWLLEALLQSPRFLYLLETTREDGYLDGYAIGGRLSTALWGSVPDDALITAAESGELDTPEGVRAQAERMMDDPRFIRGLSRFVEQWVELEELEVTAERPDFAELPIEEQHALLAEPGAFMAAHIRDGATLEELLTSAQTAHDPALDAFYGDESIGTNGVYRELDPNRRGGLVTLPAVQAALAHSDVTSPSRRGQIVLAKLLCSPIPPPPPGVSPTLPPVSETATLRERLSAHFENPTCAGCHNTMDGIGFAFESYDELGRFRTEDSRGNAVDTVSEFTIDGHDIAVSNAVELMNELGARWDVATCFATHWLRYATGINETADSVCLVDELGLAGRGDGGLREMVLAYVTSEWFRRPRTEGE